MYIDTEDGSGRGAQRKAGRDVCTLGHTVHSPFMQTSLTEGVMQLAIEYDIEV